MSGKKGQITLFIILGIVVLVGVGLYLGIRNDVITTTLDLGRDLSVEEVPLEFSPVKYFIDECLEIVGEDGLRAVGARGGFVDPWDYGISTTSEPTESDAVRMAPYSDYSVPYWYYMKSGNDCEGQCEFIAAPDNLLYLYRLDGEQEDRPSIEKEIEDYINGNLDVCLNDFEILRNQGFSVEVLGDVDSDVRIRDNEIVVFLKYPLEVSKASSRKISEFLVRLPVDIKGVYQLSKEIVQMQSDSRFLEMDLKNKIAAFSDTDSNMLPPTDDTAIGFGGGVRWPVEVIKMNFIAMLTSYVQALHVSNTFNDRQVNTGDSRLDYAYNSEMLVEVAADHSNLEVNFLYYDWWPIYFKTNCRGGMCRPESFSSNSLSFPVGTQDYNTAYDVSYPVLVQVRDPYAFNRRGYSFYFFMESNLRNNNAMPANYVSSPALDTGSSMFCDVDKRNSGEITVNVYDSDGYKVDGVEVFYSCADETCHIGSTENGVLSERFPLCLGGVVSVVKENYVGASAALDTQLDSEDLIEFTLRPIVLKNFVVKKKLIEKKYSGNFGYWHPTLREVELREGESALISLEKIRAVEQEEFNSVASYSWNQTEPSEIRVGEGDYMLTVYLLLDEKVTIPASVVEGVDIPAYEFPEPYPSGGLIRNITITDYNLRNSDLITFYALSHNLYDLDESEMTIDDIDDVVDIEKSSKMYGYGAWPEFK
ncbi:MAG: hypothetical protein U9O94_11770 [Nanoarchaeota archaeon]|nr:hypothetical protein [Nanoarchaeota archaeon]